MNDQKLLEMMSQLIMEVSTIKQTVESISTRVESVEQSVDKLSVGQENVVIPRLELLYEGHVTLQRQLQDRAYEEKLKEVQSDVRLHTDAIKQISGTIQSMQDDIAALKHA